MRYRDVKAADGLEVGLREMEAVRGILMVFPALGNIGRASAFCCRSGVPRVRAGSCTFGNNPLVEFCATGEIQRQEPRTSLSETDDVRNHGKLTTSVSVWTTSETCGGGRYRQLGR